MLDIGFQEILVLGVIALLVFGPDKLPDLGKRLGRAMREFRRASDDFRSTIETNLRINDDSILPPSATVTPSAEPSAAEPAVASSPDPAEPGATTAGEPTGPLEEPAVPAVTLPEDPFCAQRGGRLLHRTGCAWVGRIAEADRIAVKTEGEGWELGLKPCPACNPGGGELTRIAGR
jgi:TatA/E family protein of Tat protein translocase